MCPKGVAVVPAAPVAKAAAKKKGSHAKNP